MKFSLEKNYNLRILGRGLKGENRDYRANRDRENFSLL